MAGLPKIKEWKAKLVFTLVYFLWLVMWRILDLPCLFQHFLHIPCPGCGMTRATIAALHLDFTAAFGYHLMFWAMPLLYLYFLFDGRLCGNPRADKAILWTIAAGFLVNWAILLANA